MDEEEFEVEEIIPAPSRRFRKIDLVVIGLNLVHGVAHAVAETATTAHDLVVMHANWKVDQDEFHQDAALEIETLTEGGNQDA